MKRGKKKSVKIVLSNRWLYTFIALGIILIVAGGVYATLGAVPNPGHAVAELQPCSGTEILKMNGAGAWTCGDDAGGGTSQWTTLGSNIYYNTGNVGIGTASPGSALHLGTTGWSANQLHFSSGWGTAGTHATIGSGYSGITASGIMLGTPHVPWRASYGAKIRYASDQAATNYWDWGMSGETGGSTDRFDLRRNNVALLTISDKGNVGIVGSVTASSVAATSILATSILATNIAASATLTAATSIVAGSGTTGSVSAGSEICLRSSGSGCSASIANGIVTAGSVTSRGTVFMGYEVRESAWVTSSSSGLTVACTTGNKVLGGGCRCLGDFNPPILWSFPASDGTSWTCRCSGGSTKVFAVCARIG